MKLNLGCGRDIRKGWVNLDWKAGPGVNVVHDLRTPLPFPSGSITHVLAYNVLEHLSDWENLVTDIHRVLKPKGRLYVNVPYRLNCNTFHRRYFDETSFDGFIEGSHDFFSGDATTLEGIPAFNMISMRSHRRPIYPFAWHLKRYLRFPYIGPKESIHFILEKREAP